VQEFIIFDFPGVPLTIGCFKDRPQEIGERLIGTEDPEIALILIELDHVAQELTSTSVSWPSTAPGEALSPRGRENPAF